MTLLLAAMGQFLLIQRDKPWTAWAGCGLYAIAIPLFLRFTLASKKKSQPSAPLSPGLEAILFFMILGLAAFFRTYRLGEFPPGIFTDEACEGWGALRILQEGWRPFYEIYHLLVWDQIIYFGLALWFKILTPTKEHFFLFSAVISLITFPLVYWVFRQLTAVPVALLGLFLLAVMRWDVTYSRDGHPAILILFFMFGALGFWLYALKERNAWALAAGTFFFASGFYAYQAYKAFLLLALVYALYELWLSKFKNSFLKTALPTAALATLAVTSPLWTYRLKMGNLGDREKELFIIPSLFQDWNILPLIEHFLGTALMFNRQGDPWFLHNLPGHRMLDDVTGLFFIFGVALAWTRVRERKYFYPLTGFLVMSLPAFLSVNAAHASRAFGGIPFVCFLSALGLSAIWERVQAFKPAIFLLAAVLSLMTFQNFTTYFGKQAGNLDCWRGPSTDATYVGEKIARESDQFEYYLSSHFIDHYSVKFLAYSERNHTHELGLYKDSLPSLSPPSRGLFFALEEGQSGVFQLLQVLYPGGESETVRDPSGRVLVYFYRVPLNVVEKDRPLMDKFSRGRTGLTGTYFHSLDWNSRPTLVHRDALINFTFRNDFPLDPATPFLVHWTGNLYVPFADRYQFLALTTDEARMTLDGKTVFFEGNAVSRDISLNRGPHKMDLFFRKISGTDTALSLAWKKQGGTKFEVVPCDAYRPSLRPFHAE